jgi:hypothetical protein
MASANKVRNPPARILDYPLDLVARLTKYDRLGYD